MYILLKYTTFNEFSINFDWHFSLHTSLVKCLCVFLSAVCLSLSPQRCPYKCPGCGSSMKRFLRLGHAQMIDFWDFMLKLDEQTETKQHFYSKFKQSNNNNFGFIISVGESTTGRHVMLTNTHTHRQRSGKNLPINQITYQKLIRQYQVTASGK